MTNMQTRLLRENLSACSVPIFLVFLILSDGVLGWEDEFSSLFSFLFSCIQPTPWVVLYLTLVDEFFDGVEFLMTDVSKIDFSLHILPYRLCRLSLSQS